MIGKTDSLLGLLGTDDARQIIERIESGDKWAEVTVGWIAPTKVCAGNFEMDELAPGGIRALGDIGQAMTYTGKPSWTGSDMDGAFADVEA